ncbi:MAG: septal ring lytic transglycosylase RlpA family protein [Cyclobacteriaceae bacterium]
MAHSVIAHSKILLQTVVILLFALSSCKATKTSTSSKNVRGQRIETGIASWYGPGFQGKKTANGEKFNTNTLTAAHRTLPFDTKLRVENLDNGQSVTVRINDRGPYSKDRIIDLSKKAADQLSMLEAGTARVELFLLNGSKNDLNVDNLKRPTYAIQVASFSDRESASRRAKDFPDGWIKQVVVKQKIVYRVLVGKFAEVSPAKKRNAELRLRGTNGFVKQIEN